MINGGKYHLHYSNQKTFSSSLSLAMRGIKMQGVGEGKGKEEEG
jgi:hypothetical protein